MIDETQKKMIEEYAQTIAINLVLYGVDIREKYDSAVSMSLALENAYLRGRSDGLKYAFEKAKKVGEWIPVSERLPEEDGKYIVCTKKRSVYCAKYSNDYKEFHTDSYTHIIAWMPLPEPYKE